MEEAYDSGMGMDEALDMMDEAGLLGGEDPEAAAGAVPDAATDVSDGAEAEAGSGIPGGAIAAAVAGTGVAGAAAVKTGLASKAVDMIKSKFAEEKAEEAKKEAEEKAAEEAKKAEKDGKKKGLVDKAKSATDTVKKVVSPLQGLFADIAGDAASGENWSFAKELQSAMTTAKADHGLGDKMARKLPVIGAAAGVVDKAAETFEIGQ